MYTFNFSYFKERKKKVINAHIVNWMSLYLKTEKILQRGLVKKKDFFPAK